MSCCRFDVRLSESYPNASSHWGCKGGRQSEGVQPEFTSTATNQLSFPPLHQLCLFIYLLFSPPSLCFPSPDFSSSCVTQFSQRWATSPLVCVTQQSRAKPAASPSPSVTQIFSETRCLRLHQIAVNGLWFVIRNMCFSPRFAGQEQSTEAAGQSIWWVSSSGDVANHMWGTHSHRKWTFFVSCG